MFPNDRPAGTAYRDAQTEHELLGMFTAWAMDTEDCVWANAVSAWLGPEPNKKYAFHANLARELREDTYMVTEDLGNAKRGWTDLQTWQHMYLDTDAGLTYARKELDAGRNVFWTRYGREARKVYEERLEPIPRDDLETWESLHLGAEGTVARWKEGLRECTSLLGKDYFGGRKAWDKYYNVLWRLQGVTIKTLAKRLRAGEDVWQGLSEQDNSAARYMFQHLFEGLPGELKHDLKTWNGFILTETGMEQPR